MSSPTTANVRNGFLSASPPDDMNSPSGRRRSTSVTPSERSSRSRMTVVEHDSELASYHGHSDYEHPESYKTVKIYPPRYTWYEHLLGLFCINVAKNKEPITREERITTKVPESEEMDDEDSPWVLPVYVLSSRRDTDKQPVKEEAKCTIDTGNQQGNIVSRDFVVNVLHFPKANIKPLSEKEKRGGTSVTGHKLMPEGAIYLTWYHRKSTRVFRDMRFLISPNQHYDLIIGAHSIRAHNLLDVPNMMANGNTGKTVPVGQPEDREKMNLENEEYKASQQVNNLKSRIAKDPNAENIKNELAQAQKKLADAKKALQDYKPSHVREADADSHKLQKTPTEETEPGDSTTKETADATGIDSQTTEKKLGIKRIWKTRSRAS